jgi:hypothetical protein
MEAKKTVPESGSIWKRAANAANKAMEKSGGEEDEDLLWIVWKFEGKDTLARWGLYKLNPVDP